MIACKERNGINAEREGKQRQTTTTTTTATTTTTHRLHLLRAFSCSWFPVYHTIELKKRMRQVTDSVYCLDKIQYEFRLNENVHIFN